MAQSISPILLIGGTGLVGTRVVEHIRRLHPDLPLAIAARNAVRGRDIAERAGNAEFLTVDLTRPELGLPARPFGAVVALVKENTLNPLRLAEAASIPYLSMADGAFEIAPAVARHILRPLTVPMLLAGQWAAGVTSLATLHYAEKFQRVQSIEATVILDPDEPVGPMAASDVEQIMLNSPRPLMLREGRWQWAAEPLATRKVVTATGETVEVQAMSVLDTVDLAAITDAQSVRFDFGSAMTAARKAGGPAAHEMIIVIEGVLKDGRTGQMRVDIETSQGASGLTALGVTLGLERLLGLAGEPPLAPGLYVPESVIDPAYAVKHVLKLGGKLSEAPLQETRSAG